MIGDCLEGHKLHLLLLDNQIWGEWADLNFLPHVSSMLIFARSHRAVLILIIFLLLTRKSQVEMVLLLVGSSYTNNCTSHKVRHSTENTKYMVLWFCFSSYFTLFLSCDIFLLCIFVIAVI